MARPPDCLSGECSESNFRRVGVPESRVVFDRRVGNLLISTCAADLRSLLAREPMDGTWRRRACREIRGGGSHVPCRADEWQYAHARIAEPLLGMSTKAAHGASRKSHTAFSPPIAPSSDNGDRGKCSLARLQSPVRVRSCLGIFGGKRVSAHKELEWSSPRQHSSSTNSSSIISDAKMDVDPATSLHRAGAAHSAFWPPLPNCGRGGATKSSGY